MKYSIGIGFQLFIGFLFILIFFVSTYYLDGYIYEVNEEKRDYPVLVYTNTLSEATEMAEFMSERAVYQSHEITSPENLESMLIEKYGFTDYRSMVRDFSLPFLLEIKIKPFPAEMILDFIGELTSQYPRNVVHFNEEKWKEIDSRLERTRYISFGMKFLFLLIYLFLQFCIRYSMVLKNKEVIEAIVHSGITPQKLASKRIKENLSFLLYIFILIVLINYLVNSLLFFGEPGFGIEYFNLPYIVILLVVNTLLVVFQKPLYKIEK